MRKTGLKDSLGNDIHDGDVLVKHHETIPERTQEDIDEMMSANPGVAFGLAAIPHDEIPAFDEYHTVKWDDKNAMWDVPRDYGGIEPDLEDWIIKSKGEL